MDALVTRFQHKQQEMERMALKDQLEEEDKIQQQIQEQRLKLIQKFKEQQHKNSETLAKIRFVLLCFHIFIRIISFWVIRQ